jgi:hypothetical protein
MVMAGWLPKKLRETTAATTLLTTTAGNAPTASEPRISSSAKKAPVRGALNAAEIPAAAPAATRILMRDASKRNACPRNEPRVAPRTATGPSLPADPPPPSVTALAAVRASAGRVGMKPPRRATASCTSGMFRPGWPAANRRTIHHASNSPTAVTADR